MAVTEFAILRLQPTSKSTFATTQAVDPTLLRGLSTVKTAMEKSSGYRFHYYRDVEYSDIIYILGAWPSIKYHMETWIPSKENQDMLELLKGEVAVEDMFHIDIDQIVTPLPTDAEVLVIRKHHVESKAKRERYDEVRRQLAERLDGSAVSGKLVGGWRLDGLQQGKEEYFGFLGSDGSGMERSAEYANLMDCVDAFEIYHANPLNVADSGLSKPSWMVHND